MSRYNPHQRNARRTYEAAEYWRDHCLLSDGSVFSDKNLWKRSIFAGECQRYFIKNLDLGKDDFIKKLAGQFKESKPATKQLLAEILWFLSFGNASAGVKPETKREEIETVWGWSGADIPDRMFLEDNYLEGLGYFGPGFGIGKWRELFTFILFMQAWKKLEADEQKALAKDSNGFSEKLDDWLKGFDSQNITEEQPKCSTRQIRHILNHLLFPDDFERIFSSSEKKKIIKHYKGIDIKNREWPESDRFLKEIRDEQEKKHGTQELDFYNSPLKDEWNPPRNTPKKPKEGKNDQTVSDEGQIKEPSMPYAPVGPLNRILYGPPGTGKTYHTTNAALEILDPDFYQENKADRRALYERFKALKKDGQIDFVTFHQSFSYEDFVEGIRPAIEDEDDDRGGISYEMKGGVFKRLCEQAKSDKSSGSFDQAIEQLKKDCEVDNPDDPEKTIALKTARGKEFEIWYSGGKNFNARTKLPTGEGAYSGVRVENLKKLYIDPETRVNRRARHRAVINYIKAQYKIEKTNLGNASKRYVLIIDEINRGNIAKIFGELITLIEPSKRLGNEEAIEVTLPYSGEQFGVPGNLYLIGTMNTADRSIALLDTALRRRFRFIEMMPKAKLLNDIGDVAGVDISRLFTAINQRIEALYDRDHQIGHTYFLDLKEDPSLNKLADIFRHAVLPLLQEYFYDDWKKIRVVLNNNEFVFADHPPKMKDTAFMDEEKKIWQIAGEAVFEQAAEYQKIYQDNAEETSAEDNGNE